MREYSLLFVHSLLIFKKIAVRMRITSQEHKIIKEAVKFIDPEAKVYLYGSRTDDSKKGGDIDLFILSKTINKELLSKLRWELYEKIGLQKIDIIVSEKPDKPFHRIALTTGVEL